MFFEILQQTWHILLESGWYILGGLAVAGMLHVFVNPQRIARMLGRRSVGAVIKGSLLGIPLPLCSCSVIPVAAALKKDGASDPAIVAFLISEPENGADSISLSWALLDPLMTVMRVVGATFTAFCAGIAALIFMPDTQRAGAEGHAGTAADPCCNPSHNRPAATIEHDACCAPAAEPSNAGPTDCCASGTSAIAHAPSAASTPSSSSAAKFGSLAQRFWQSQHYAFTTLFGDLAKYYWIGLLAAGAVAALVPDQFFERFTGGNLSGMLLILAVSIPLYICAASSTPLAAALLLKGVSPGTVLVLLLAGPATNIATMMVVKAMLGLRGLGIYLGSIALCSLLVGLLTDRLYLLLNIDVIAGLHYQPVAHEHHSLFWHTGAALFLLLLLYTMFKKWFGRIKKDPAQTAQLAPSPDCHQG